MRSRRDILKTISGATGAALARPVGAYAAPKLTIVAHAVHKAAATTGPGGDVTAAWREKNGATIEWLTFGVEEANQRALKEASLSQGSVDIAFMLDRYTGPQYANLFENLNDWQKKDPIPNLDEIPAGMRAAHTFGGKLTAIPFRHATQGFFYNTALLAERGLTAPPKTIEEVVTFAERLTYSRTDGTKVFGLIFNMDDPSSPLDWIRSYGGDFIAADYTVVADTPASVAGVTMLCELCQKNVIPRDVMNFKNEDVNNYMQQGRAAMTNNAFGRYFTFNDPKASKFPGKIEVMALPLGTDGKPAPAKTSVWAMAIPSNTTQKELAWSLIRHLSLPESTIAEALNGNGPVRPSAYNDPRVIKAIPYAAEEQRALAGARLVVPSFPNAARAMDIFMEELDLAMLNRKTPQAAMSDVKKRVQPLLPA